MNQAKAASASGTAMAVEIEQEEHHQAVGHAADDARRSVAEQAAPRRLQPPGRGHGVRDRMEDGGQDVDREDRAGHEIQRPGDRFGVRPRLLAQLEAPAGHEDAERHDRQDAEHARRHQVEQVQLEVDAQEEDANGQCQRHRDERDDHPRQRAAEEEGEQRRRRDDNVLDHPVALAVLEDRLHQPGHDAEDDVPQRAADDEELEPFRTLPLGDDLEHDHQDQGSGQRLGEGVDEEEKWIGPVRLDRPAEADRGAEAAPRVREGEAADPCGATDHCHRRVRRPSRRASRSR